MRIANPTWDIDSALLQKGEKNNVDKWRDVLNSEIAIQAFEIIKQDILGMEYIGNDLASHALKNAERQGAIKIFKKLYDLGNPPQSLREEMPEPWSHLKPTEEEGLL